MKVDLQAIDRNNFMAHEHIVNGQVLTLVQPIHIGAKWTQDNKHFRSSVWNSEGELVSAGLPKFTNWGENPEHFPVPANLNDCSIMEKLDGSLLIVSKYKGHYMLRTRGTVDAFKLDNGDELHDFADFILPQIDKTFPGETWPVSVLFEWTSPKQKIVISYGDKPNFTLVAVIDHSNYYLHSQSTLNDFAKGLGVDRPQVYDFTSVEDLMANVEAWKGKEGVCVYSNGGQSIHKVKGAWYLALHHMKSEFSSIDKVVDYWFAAGKPDYATFWEQLLAVDYEIAQQCRGFVSIICDGYKEVQKIVAGMERFVKDELSRYPTRKLQAVVTIQSYGQTNRASFVFKLLDGKPLVDDDLKKLLYQVNKGKA